MAKSLRLSRFGLILWLLAPFVIVAVLWTQMDPSRGKPRPLPIPSTPALPADASPDAPVPPRDPSSDAAPSAVAPPQAPAAPVPDHPSSLVEPESLVQGFVVVVTDLAKRANESSPIYLASNHHGWNPGDPNQRLTPRPDGRWQLVVSKPATDSRLEFKFTRGDWGTVEVGPDLHDIENRSLPLVDESKLESGERPTIEFTVPAWADQRAKSGGEKGGTAASATAAIRVAGGRVERLQVVGGGVPITRDLIIWLPPGYDDPANAAHRYPVLYMQDGQNVFDRASGVPGEWRADETGMELIAAGSIEPLIIVGIPHAGAERVTEYLPTPALSDVTPRGDAYVEFVVNEVMPRVERTFRVETGPDHTAIGGSSLGGLISLYAALKRPDIFGKVLAESPSLRIRGREIWKEAFDGFRKGPRVIVLGMGGREMGEGDESRLLVESLESFRKWLEERGIGEVVESRIDPAAVHSEQAWAGRLPGALRTLFPKRP